MSISMRISYLSYSSYLNYIALLVGLVVLTGCSTINKVFDNKESVNYKTAKTVSSLEVPPDLTSPQYDSTFEVNSGKVSASTSTGTINVGVPDVHSNTAAGKPAEQKSTSVENSANVSGQPSLKISGSYDDVWDRTGVSLKRIGFTLEDQNKVKGRYAVKWAGYSKKGKSLSEQLQQIFSFQKEILEEGTEQLVRVSSTGEGAVLQVFNKNGSAANLDVAKKILDRLKKELSR